jgi:hypothetical protein
MEKVMPTFDYEPFIICLEPKTSYEENDRWNINGA